MPGSTAGLAMPYPLATEPVSQGDDAIKALADRIEAVLAPVWTSWAPSVTASSGTFNNMSPSNGRYLKVGKTVHWAVTITITDAGTAAGSTLRLIAPSPPATPRSQTVGFGRESQATGVMVQVLTTASHFEVLRYDNTSVIASGRTVQLSGTYEAA